MQNKVVAMIEYVALNRDAYDQTAPQFLQKIHLRKPADQRIVERLSKYLPCAGVPVLDIGPGNGQMSKFLCDKKYLVYAIEFSEPMAAVAKITAPEVNMIIDDFVSHDFGNQKFQGILASAFIHLFPKHQGDLVLRKMHGLLETNGVVYISTTKNKTSNESLTAKTNFESQPIRFRRYFTKDELLKDVHASGFTLLEYYENEDLEVPGKCWMELLARRI